MEELLATTRPVSGNGRARARRAAFVCSCAVLLCFLSPMHALAQRANPAQGPTPAYSPSPTPEPLRTKLENEKLARENEKLGLENQKLALENQYDRRGFWNWLYGNTASFLAMLVAAVGLFRYFYERKKTRLNREEERFEGVVKSLGSQYEQERISAAVLLLTFLDPKNSTYRRFHEQVFNLAAGHLRKGPSDVAPSTPTKIEIPGMLQEGRFSFYVDRMPATVTAKPDMPLDETTPPLDDVASRTLPDPLTQPLANVLCRSYRILRDAMRIKSEDERPEVVRRRLNAAGVHMEGVDLSGIDLRYAWLKQASLRGATFRGAFLDNAILIASNMSEAILRGAQLIEANLRSADLTRAVLDKAALNGSVASGADFSHASARGTRFDDADLSHANLTGVDFGPADGRPANPEAALTLQGAIFQKVRGLTDEQRRICVEKGANFRDGKPTR